MTGPFDDGPRRPAHDDEPYEYCELCDGYRPDPHRHNHEAAREAPATPSGDMFRAAQLAADEMHMAVYTVSSVGETFDHRRIVTIRLISRDAIEPGTPPAEEPSPCAEHEKWGNRLSCAACAVKRREFYQSIEPGTPPAEECGPGCARLGGVPHTHG